MIFAKMEPGVATMSGHGGHFWEASSFKGPKFFFDIFLYSNLPNFYIQFKCSVFLGKIQKFIE